MTTTLYDTFPITANYEEDDLLEYCKQATWDNSIVNGAKRCNSSWPQVTLFNDLVPNIYQVAPSSIRNTYFSTLENYGDFVKYFKTFAPGRRQTTTQIMNSNESKKYETWGYELIIAQHYSDDERYKDGIFPSIISTGPMELLLVIYPPIFAPAFELDSQYLREEGLGGKKNKNKIQSPMTTTPTPITQLHSSSIATQSDITSTLNDDFHRYGHRHDQYGRSNMTSKQRDDSFIPGTLAGNEHEKLSIQIEELYRNSVPPRYFMEQRKRLVDKVVNLLRRQFPKIKLRVEMFGSSATGLDFIDSDLDLCIIVPSPLFSMDVYDMFHKQRERNSYYNMFCLSGILKRGGMINIAAVPRANVPICKFEDPHLQIKADINTHNDMGVENSKLIKEYTSLDPRVRPFLYAIKTFTKMRKINDSTASTLSSYTYVLMGLFYLMTCSPPVIPNLQKLNGDHNDAISCDNWTCRSKISKPKLSLYRGKPKHFDVSFHNCVTILTKDQPLPSTKRQEKLGGGQPTYWRCHNQQTVGSLLVGFFAYYGLGFDYKTTISIRVGTTIPKLPGWRKRSSVAVEDPFIKERNVAISCSVEGFHRVIDEFQRAHRLLCMNVDLETVCEPIPTPTISYDDHFNDNAYARRFEIDDPQLQNVTNTLKATDDVVNQTMDNYYDPTFNHGSTTTSSFKTPVQIKMPQPDKLISSSREDDELMQQQEHIIVFDARQQMDQTPQVEEEELDEDDMDTIEFSPLTPIQQRKQLLTNNKRQIESKSMTPSQENDVKLNHQQQRRQKKDQELDEEKKSKMKIDSNESELSRSKKSTITKEHPVETIGLMETIVEPQDNSTTASLFAESSKEKTLHEKIQQDEDRVIGTLSSDEEEEEEEEKTLLEKKRNDDISPTLTKEIETKTVIVKKATMKLMDLPHHVDKMDIINALEAFGFEIITIRSEIVQQAGNLGLLSIKEWIVRINGGRSEDLPTRFEVQDMMLVKSYKTRRNVVYRGIHLNTAFALV